MPATSRSGIVVTRAGLGEKVGTIRGRQFPRGEVDGIQVFQNTLPLLHA